MVIATNISPAMQLEMSREVLHLRCVDPPKNKRRFYTMSVEPTLFGEWDLVREWGRIGRGGRVRHDGFSSVADALDALAALAKQKTRRGYKSTRL
jgi:predicted DNA-binding WGR domain protein